MADWLIRALKTFVQAFAAAFLADISVIEQALADWSTGKHVLFTVGIGAVAAGISAAWNIILEALEAKK